MDYPTYDAFHQALVEYLNKEKDLYEADIEARKALSDEEKEERGISFKTPLFLRIEMLSFLL